jgi:hypothetical protein
MRKPGGRGHPSTVRTGTELRGANSRRALGAAESTGETPPFLHWLPSQSANGCPMPPRPWVTPLSGRPSDVPLEASRIRRYNRSRRAPRMLHRRTIPGTAAPWSTRLPARSFGSWRPRRPWLATAVFHELAVDRIEQTDCPDEPDEPDGSAEPDGSDKAVLTD